jgi:hypothetical protein
MEAYLLRRLLEKINMNNQSTRQDKAPGFLLIRHQIIVDGQTIYSGEDWSRADSLFTRHVQRLDVTQVIHQVDKAVVAYHHDLLTSGQRG